MRLRSPLVYLLLLLVFLFQSVPVAEGATTPCLQQYRAAVTEVRTAHLGRGLEQKVITKLDNGWRKYASLSKNGPDQAVKEVQNALDLLDGNATKKIPLAEAAKIRTAISSFLGCLKSTPVPGSATITVRALLQESAASAPVSAGAGVSIVVGDEQIATTGTDGKATFKVIPGITIITAHRAYTTAGSATVDLANGQTTTVDVVMSAGKQITERGEVEVPQMPDGVLPSTFTTVSLQYSRDGAVVPITTIGSVFLEAPGALLNVSDLFTIGTAGDVRLTQPDKFRAFVDERLDPFVLRVHAVDKLGKFYYRSIPFTIGRYALSGSIAAPASVPSLPRAGVYLKAVHTASGMTFRAVSDASGNFRFDGIPEGAYHVAAETTQNNAFYAGTADAVVRANTSVTVTLRGAAEYLTEDTGSAGGSTSAAGQATVASNANGPEIVSALGLPQEVRSVLFEYEYVTGLFEPLGHFRGVNPRPLKQATEAEIAETIDRANTQREGSTHRMVVRAWDRSGKEIYQGIADAARWSTSDRPGEAKEPHGAARELLRKQVFVVRVPENAARITVQHGWITSSYDLDGLEQDPSLRYFDASRIGKRPVRAAAYNSPNSVNVVVTGDGFTNEAEFNAAYARISAGLGNYTPYKEYGRYFSYRPYFVASEESGIDEPAFKESCPIDPITNRPEENCCQHGPAKSGHGSLRKTRFNARFCSDPNNWYALDLSWSAVFAELLARDIAFDQVIVIGNSNQCCGTALLNGDINITVLSNQAELVVTHEFSHAFVGLADEYSGDRSPGCSDSIAGSFPCEANITDVADRATIKWRDWIKPETPVPFPDDQFAGPEVVSAFRGARYTTSLYRPGYFCMMNAAGGQKDFCKVCAQEISLRVWDYASILEHFSPGPSVIMSIGTTQVFSVSTGAAFPKVEWFVDGVLKQSDSRTDFRFTPAAGGKYRVEARVSEDSPFVLASRRTSRMQGVANWSVDAGVPTNIHTTVTSRGTFRNQNFARFRVPAGINTVNLRYDVTTTETEGRSDAWGVLIIATPDTTNGEARHVLVPPLSGQIRGGETIGVTQAVDITAFQDADGVTLELYVTAEDLVDANNPTTVAASLNFTLPTTPTCGPDTPGCPAITIESVTPEIFTSTAPGDGTMGDSTFYSIPFTGERNVKHRAMTMKVKVTPSNAPFKLDVTLLGKEPITQIANVRSQTITPDADGTYSVRVTFDEPMQGGTGLPVAYSTRYRFRTTVTVDGRTSESVYDALTLKAGDPPGATEYVRGLHALYHLPPGVSRFGARENGGDDWISPGAYEWLRANAPRLTQVDDVSGEHATNLGHNDHQYGSDIDVAHFPNSANSAPPESRFSNVRNSFLRTLTGELQREDVDRIIGWIASTRDGLRELFFERVGNGYIPRVELSDEVLTIVLPRGEPCQTNISKPEYANWAQQWVINGNLPGVYEAGPPLNQTAGFKDYPGLIDRLVFSCDHSDRITIKLNRCKIGSEGPCGGRRRAVSPRSANVTTPPPIKLGESATLHVSVAEGDEPLIYRWYHGRTGDTSRPVPSGYSPSLTVSPNESSEYWVSVLNYIGSSNSNTATVTVIQPCTPIEIDEQPASKTIVIGQAATLHVETTGTDPRRYTWFSATPGRAFTVVPFGGGASLFVAPQETTSYRVEIVNGCGVVISETATITVKPPCVPASVSAQPQPASIIEGQTATLTVSANGTALQYQWLESSSRTGPFAPIAGATSTSLMVAPVTTTYYLVRITGECGNAESVAVAVTVAPACKPPAINAQPTSRSITEGEAVTLTVSATGTAPEYQWFIGERGDTSSPIAGATSSSLTVTPLDTTSYWVHVSNECGSLDSATATIVVTPACTTPAITGEPQGGTINPGQTLTLTASATGSSLSYQWFVGVAGDTSAPVIGATTTTLVVSPDTTTRYWMRALNTCGIANTVSVLVTVTPACVAPAISAAPQPTSIVEGQVATLTVSATGTSLQYQWFAGAVGDLSNPVSGGTSSSVAVSPGVNTSYWCRVSNDCGSVMSPAALVTVSQSCTAPDVPSSTRTIDSPEAGASVTFEVVPTAGTAPLLYQWFASSPSGSPFVALSGQTQRSITVAPTATSQYFLRVSNACDTDDSGVITVVVPPPTTCNTPSITQQPQSQSVPTGSTAVLTVSATGTLPLSYRWYIGDSGDTSQPVANSNNATLVVTVNADTRRWVRVTNSCGHADSATALLEATTSCNSPSIFAQPQSVSISPGQSTTLSVGASGTAPLRYQWYLGNGTIMSGATSSSVTVTPSQTSDFYVVVTNDCGTRTSQMARVTVEECLIPHITTQPQSQTVPYNGIVNLSVVATGQAPLSYRWYNGEPGNTTAPIYQNGQIATGPSVTFPAGTLFTTYWVRVSNACGSVDSAGAQVTMLPCANINITQQPQSVTIAAGQTVTLSVAATGDAPSYQWFRGNAGDMSSPISGATSATVNVSPSGTTSYWVRVSNACGTTFSNTATVTVTTCDAPFITNHPPQQLTINAGETVTLAVGATGSSPLTYQWFNSDTQQPVSGASSSNTFNVSPSQTTTYYAVVRNDCGEAFSNHVIVNVNVIVCDAPVVTSPTAQVNTLVRIGFSKTLTVVATGTGPLQYQWFESVPEGAPFTAIPGATGASITVRPEELTHYYVRVSNECGTVNSPQWRVMTWDGIGDPPDPTPVNQQ